MGGIGAGGRVTHTHTHTCKSPPPRALQPRQGPQLSPFLHLAYGLVLLRDSGRRRVFDWWWIGPSGLIFGLFRLSFCGTAQEENFRRFHVRDASFSAFC